MAGIEMEHILLTNLLAVALLQCGVWVVSVARHDASVADLAWGCCFTLVSWLSVANTDSPQIADTLIAAMVTLWGVRLTAYLTYRNWGQPEDRRYRLMRDKHGRRFPMVSLLTVFGLQGLLAWIIALPIQVGILTPGATPALLWIGSILWGIGLALEAVADAQLARFKASPNNEGRVMDGGLWRYSRHPNYFGECVLWWGLYLASVQAESWWWTAIGPVLMTVLLLKVSGVSLLEGSLSGRLGGYEDYARRTSVFVPWPPKEKAS